MSINVELQVKLKKSGEFLSFDSIHQKYFIFTLFFIIFFTKVKIFFLFYNINIF